jgi:hypothetical protein
MLNVLKLTPSLTVCRQGVQSGTLQNLGKVESGAHSVRPERGGGLPREKTRVPRTTRCVNDIVPSVMTL